MSEIIESDYVIKLIILGDTSVGKTSVIERYIGNNFRATIPSTVGVDCTFRDLNIMDRKIKVQIWDTAGQEIFRSIVQNYYRRSNGVLLVYDLTSRTSFDSLVYWFQEIEEHCDNVEKILLGNKTDLIKKREIQTIEGEKLAKKRGCYFEEVSAQSGKNIESSYQTIIESIVKKLVEQESEKKKEKIKQKRLKQNEKQTKNEEKIKEKESEKIIIEQYSKNDGKKQSCC
ncbi:ras and ef-hand domain-containing protein [Anaeramoeba flamelloides]|uniref:Ras and ef-hand domain-containing protein n=1 Tax=Anaeramoeba flamelloides TaxID=1746091 RepID=A0AAV7Z1M2_9EUKA|nr:ras and ef-hand domain-containing protein [Anaeramoeba flamelloides]KAJ6240527.1 ras and ef-hand domain-containing protein [Anaeramoeba flamelloides]